MNLVLVGMGLHVHFIPILSLRTTMEVIKWDYVFLTFDVHGQDIYNYTKHMREGN